MLNTTFRSLAKKWYIKIFWAGLILCAAIGAAAYISKPLLIQTSSNNLITALAFDPTGERLATGGDAGSVQLWNAADGRLLQTFSGPLARMSSLAFSPHGHSLAGSDWAGRIYLIYSLAASPWQ